MTGWPLITMNLALTMCVFGVIIGGLCNRYHAGKVIREDPLERRAKGIGWQFIRYTVLASALPIIALLALNDVLRPEAATLIGTCVGFAFGSKEDKNNPPFHSEVQHPMWVNAS